MGQIIKTVRKIGTKEYPCSLYGFSLWLLLVIFVQKVFQKTFNFNSHYF